MYDDNCKLTHRAYWLYYMQFPLENRENKTREMSVWAKFAKISSSENFYFYSIPDVSYTTAII